MVSQICNSNKSALFETQKKFNLVKQISWFEIDLKIVNHFLKSGSTFALEPLIMSPQKYIFDKHHHHHYHQIKNKSFIHLCRIKNGHINLHSN